MERIYSKTDIPFLILKLEQGDINKYNINLLDSDQIFADYEKKNANGESLRDQVVQIGIDILSENLPDLEGMPPFLQMLLSQGQQNIHIDKGFMHYPFIFEGDYYVLLIEKEFIGDLLQIDAEHRANFENKMDEFMHDNTFVSSLLTQAMYQGGIIGDTYIQYDYTFGYHFDNFKNVDDILKMLSSNDNVALEVFKCFNGYNIYFYCSEVEYTILTQYLDGYLQLDNVEMHLAMDKEHSQNITENAKQYYDEWAARNEMGIEDKQLHRHLSSIVRKALEDTADE